MAIFSEMIGDLYERHAYAWDEGRGPLLPEKAWLDRFIAQLPPHRHVLELGCGSGQPQSSYLVANGCRVTGVDVSPTLIAICSERLPDQRWIAADMRNLSLAERFEGILAWDSFFHLTPEAQRRMFPIFAAHAAPGAALMFTTGPEGGEAIGQWQGEPLYHASLDPAEYRHLLAAAGFEVLAHVAEDPDCGRHTIWLARSLE